MQKPFDQLEDDAPLYIRWSPDRSPYAIELRLDLVAKIREELAQAAQSGMEIGGVLVGSFPEAHMPTVRIEDAEIVPRRPEDGPIYMLDPNQHARFAEIRWRERPRNRTALGFFRSHLRPGPLRPSLADRTLLSGEFRQAVYMALLIEGRQPHTAALFLATTGQLPDEPSVREFRFDEGEFKALPEVAAEPAAAERDPGAAGRSKRRLYGIIAALVLIGIGACVLMFSFTKQLGLAQWLGPSKQLQLAVTGSDHVVRISWNHAARELEGASGATIVVTDGGNRREIKLGLDELRLGAVEYERTGSRLQVSIILNTPGAAISPSESVDWTAR